MLKYLGLALIVFASYAAYLEYRRRLEARLLDCEELLRLVRYLKNGIECYLLPLADCVSSFSSERLSSCGFFDEYEKSASLEGAFLTASNNLGLTENEKRLLTELFAGLGKSYRDAELLALSACEDKLDKLCSDLRCDVPRRVKCAGVVCASVALGTVILII